MDPLLSKCPWCDYVYEDEVDEAWHNHERCGHLMDHLETWEPQDEYDRPELKYGRRC